MIMRIPLAALLLLLALPATAANERNLNHWVEHELIPIVRQQLVEHPRFKGETVMFVILDDNAPSPVSNELALSLRDRLLDAALHTPGVLLGWQQGRGGGAERSQPVDCTRNDVHYYIGIELSKRLDDTYSAGLRALDLEDRTWVTGFGSSWRGKLTPIQRQAVSNIQTDKTFLGARDVPFTAEQTDLLAAHLAHEMTCTLSRETSGNYIVTATGAETTPDVLDGTAELVSNNLASRLTLEFTAEDEQSNATLSGKAHRIDGPLFQYWLTITPKNPDGDLSPLSASAYVSLPSFGLSGKNTVAAASTIISMPKTAKDTLLGPLRVLRTQHSPSCRGCSLLTANANADAIVFFLQYQPNYGLVRLANNACRERTAAHVITTGSPMEFPIPYVPMGRSNTRETDEWLVSPRADTYYAIAVADARAARRLANHLDKLPMRCSDAVRFGLRNGALQNWLDEFAMLTARSAQHVDWRAIEVRDVL
ncbi:MAG: hypothetical protein OEU90_01440 [Gammaproteobacteria bacterium]|nr:hypothetical protein [Gammaproteobacteria bacterium]MDH3804111.1 hypothetical protein [Gammaproteobacteria bacterium]